VAAYLSRHNPSPVMELSGVTEAGWLAYVLSDTTKAQCVLEHTRERVTALPGQE